MPAPENKFKTALKAGQLQIGFWQGLANAYTAEISAYAGFDWLLVDGEHSPNDITSIRDQLQIIDPSPSQAIVRCVVGHTHIIKQIMDIGAQTILVPMVDTAAQAGQLVRDMRYPPEGVRGAGAAVARSGRFSRIPDYLQTANAQACLLVQAESQLALDNIEAIAAVDGVDGIFIGPADLAADLGHLGDANHPDVRAAIDDAIRRIVATGKAAGILMADPVRVQHYIDLGAIFVAVGVDVTTFAQATSALAAKFRGAAVPQAGGQGY
jgi:4-hydroxy-2-oxoheptanedioate aldolase